MSKKKADPFADLCIGGTSLKSSATAAPAAAATTTSAQVVDAATLLQMIGKDDSKQQQKDDDDQNSSNGSLDVQSSFPKDPTTKQKTTTKEEDEEEILCENNVGTAADREFDALIGTMESFLMSEQLQAARTSFLKQLPPLEFDADTGAETANSVPQMEKHAHFKRYMEMLDALTDEYVTAALPNCRMEDLAAMMQERADEVSDDVLELAGLGGSESVVYETFVEMWRRAK